MYTVWNWMRVVAFAMLCGELGTCEISMVLTWPKHTASHHDHSVICYVSTVQKDPDISDCHLPGCQHLRRSSCHHNNDAYFRVYAYLWISEDVHGAHWWIPGEFILSGTYNCSIYYPGNILLLNSLVWIVSAVWEVLALCLAVWIAVKHFRELRKHSEGGIMGDCFAVLIKTHMLYFAR
jgi:hypothetical protein